MALYTFSVTEVSFVSAILKASVLALLCYLIYRFFDNDKDRYCYPPGPAGLPFLGNLLSLIATKKHQHEVVTEWTERYGDIMCIKLLNIRLFVLGDARLAQEVMSSHQMLDKMPAPVVKTLTGREFAGVAFSNGQQWQEQRRFFLSVFKKAEVDGIRFEEIIGAQAERVLAEMEKIRGQCFDPEQLIYASIGNIITKTITGVTYEYDDPKFRRVMMHSQRIFDLVGPAGLLSTIPILAAIPSPLKRQLTRAWGGVFDFIRESVENHRSVSGPNREDVDFISIYLREMAGKAAKEGKVSFDDINLLATSSEMIIGGIETSATTILWGLHTLASYPEVQRRVRQEIIEVIGQERLPRFSDRNRMPITMATITECMRHRPPAALLIPRVATQDCKIGEYDIPKGSPVTLNIWHLAQSPTLWEMPQQFRPDRFLNEDGKYDRKHEPLYFGAGRRVCPGEQLARTEIFLYITYILQRFTIRLAEGVPIDLGIRLGLTVRPEPYQIHAVKIKEFPPLLTNL